MPDWKQLVREQVIGLTLPPDVKEEILAELAAHLEETYAEARSSGLSDVAALELSMEEVTDWDVLAKDIHRARSEGNPVNRTRTLLIPTFVNLVLSSALINLCLWRGWLDMRMERMAQMPPAFQPWLLVLPICGATAALLAQRRDASVSERLIAAIAPCIAWLATLPVLGLIVACFPGAFAAVPLRSLAPAAVGWFVLPALAMLVGAVPFLRVQPAKQACE